MSNQTLARRRGPRPAARAGPRKSEALFPRIRGGAYRPLTESEVKRIRSAALDVLERVGVADPIPEFRELALARGAVENAQGRLCFPRALVEDIIAGAAHEFVLLGRDPKHDLSITDSCVYFSTEGAAVTVLDVETGAARPSTLIDFYDSVRLVDQLEHLSRFDETVVPTELTDRFELDVNKAYACVSGTTKNFGIDILRPEDVSPIIAMFDTVAGGEGRFRRRPFAQVVSSPVVSPLRYGADNSAVAILAARAGMPVQVVSNAQAGATAPAALAGTLVQGLAETLAALILVNVAVPGHPVIFGNWPVVNDLRTGAYTVAGGEHAVLAAASAQISNACDLPSGVMAGGSDSKLPDNQAGYEKALVAALAGLAGANLICEAGGMLSGLLCHSFESLVIDNEMLGAVRRAVRGIEVTDETLSVEVIEDVIKGPGHFLTHPQTLKLMETEYLYPRLADRSSPGEWRERGGADIRVRARERVRTLLASHYPSYVDPKADEAIRDRLPIRLPREAMTAGCGRW
jgi:trimethylamine--corrinoid protein Co-methyltransferase